MHLDLVVNFLVTFADHLDGNLFHFAGSKRGANRTIEASLLKGIFHALRLHIVT
jgi:hypothetical protein